MNEFHFTLANVPIPGEWARHGLCAGEMDLFFSTEKGCVEMAKRLCRECPVMDVCREFALPHPMLHGVWGGLSYRERTERRRCLLRRAG